MDYEKKYNEALERANQIRNGNPSSGTAIVVCEQIFPELKESEDERVIRTLFYLVKDHDWINGATKEECVSWLKKQKEPKPVEWSEEDEKNLELVIDCVYEFYPDPVMKYKLKDWLKRLRPSWKPSEEQMAVLLNAEGLMRANDYKENAKILAEVIEELKKLCK